MKKEILFSYFPKLTHKRAQELLTAFSSFDNAWHATFEELKRIGWNDTLAHEFILWRDNINEENIAEELDRERIRCVTKDDPEYPPLLKEIYDPPICLFVRGVLSDIRFPVAVVGTRTYTAYGKQVAEDLAAELSGQGVSIVSGLALGIDGFAHEATLNTGGNTIAVLGGGVNDAHIAPRANAGLAQRILKSGGAVISEYPPKTLPTEYSFPRRNRIIAGMSIGVLIIEAPETSGALITAQCALDNNRDVFAVPQNITSDTAVGPNNLLKMGAKPVTSATDILDALNLRDIRRYGMNTAIHPDSPSEAAILPQLSRTPVHIDEIIKRCALPGSAVSSAMTLMEMKGKVRNVGGMMYVLAR